MNYNNQLMSKNGLAVLSLAKALLKYKVGDRTPTVTELSEKLNISRGTAQSAIKTLQNNNAIHIVSKGHLGSYVIEKNDKILLELAGINLLVGAMPLPYSRKYEGLATGIITTMENKHGIPMTLSEVNINEEHFQAMAESACSHDRLKRAYVPLTVEDVKKIYQMCL